jgi:hypothetical protein
MVIFQNLITGETFQAGNYRKFTSVLHQRLNRGGSAVLHSLLLLFFAVVVRYPYPVWIDGSRYMRGGYPRERDLYCHRHSGKTGTPELAPDGERMPQLRERMDHEVNRSFNPLGLWW